MSSIDFVYTASPNTLVIQVEEGSVERGSQIDRLPGDIDRPSNQTRERVVERNGETIGFLVVNGEGIEDDKIFTFDQFSGDLLDTIAADSALNYTISSTTDSNYLIPQTPNVVHRKTKTTDVAFVSDALFTPGGLEWPKQHTLHLELPADLTAGETYTINFTNGLDNELTDISFTYFPENTFSEAIHVSQIGFDPDDPAKVAFLSTWQGLNAPLDYESGLTFWLKDVSTGENVYTGVTELSVARDVAEDPRGDNYNETDVYLMDFSDFSEPGNYTVCVEGIGCSFDFQIAENSWEQAFNISIQGLYNQRSGTAIGAPYSETEYLRSFHPDDGVSILQSEAKLIDTFEGLGTIDFSEALATSPTSIPEDVGELWGGYFDAGDWDRRIQHLAGTRQHLELLELFPNYFETLNLSLPESNESFATPAEVFFSGPVPENGLPDLLDESLWNLSFFQRLQTAEGGVRGGIESATTPLFGETSWQESQQVYAYAPDIWSSYVYAGVAARGSRVLQKYDLELADSYKESALAAIEWAEQNFDAVVAEYASQIAALDPADTGNRLREIPGKINDERNLAALELYFLLEEYYPTDDSEQWHSLFLETSVFNVEPGQPVPEVFLFENFQVHDQQEAAFLYARLSDELDIDPGVQANAQDALIRDAERRLALQEGTAFKWTKPNNDFFPAVPGALGTPQVDSILQAYSLTGDPKYLESAVLGSQFSAGANPLNTTFTVGVGDRSPQNPFVINARISGQEAPTGITVYGPIDIGNFGNFQTGSVFQTGLYEDEFTPVPSDWPIAESFFDQYWVFPLNEFTIVESIAPTAYTWGFLAAQDFIVSQLNGTEANDLLNGTDVSDLINGSSGNDLLLGNGGNDTIKGGSGNDTLGGGEGTNELLGGRGNDTLTSQGVNDVLYGGEGTDVLDASVAIGRVTAFGGRGDDHIIGSNSNDSLTGGDGQNNLSGEGGNDSLSTGKDSDTLAGGIGFDTLSAGDGNDLLLGGPGDDILWGDGGHDTLQGDNGSDELDGGTGDDLLQGGQGSDRLLGGAGSDRFGFGGLDEGVDTLLDFTANQDRIEVSASGFGGDLIAGLGLSDSQFVLGTVASNPLGQFVYDSLNGNLFFDPDGTGPVSQTQIAILAGFPNLSAGSIVVAV